MAHTSHSAQPALFRSFQRAQCVITICWWSVVEVLVVLVVEQAAAEVVAALQPQCLFLGVLD